MNGAGRGADAGSHSSGESAGSQGFSAPAPFAPSSNAPESSNGSYSAGSPTPPAPPAPAAPPRSFSEPAGERSTPSGHETPGASTPEKYVVWSSGEGTRRGPEEH